MVRLCAKMTHSELHPAHLACSRERSIFLNGTFYSASALLKRKAQVKTCGYKEGAG